MLKITRLSPNGKRLTIKLEGEILEPWVGTLRDACSKPSLRSKVLRLDLAGVHYADAAGVQLLRDLTREGFEITACSGFIDELLRLKEV